MATFWFSRTSPETKPFWKTISFNHVTWPRIEFSKDLAGSLSILCGDKVHRIFIVHGRRRPSQEQDQDNLFGLRPARCVPTVGRLYDVPLLHPYVRLLGRVG